MTGGFLAFSNALKLTQRRRGAEKRKEQQQ